MQTHAIVIRQRDQNPDSSVSRSRRARTLTKPEKIRKDAAHNWLQCKLLRNGKFAVRRVNCTLRETDVPKFSRKFLRNFSRFVRIPESRARQLESFRRADTDAMTPALRICASASSAAHRALQFGACCLDVSLSGFQNSRDTEMDYQAFPYISFDISIIYVHIF